MGNCQEYVDLTLQSVEPYVDKILIVYDTTSKDNTIGKINEWRYSKTKKIEVLERPYEHDPNIKNANGNARNHYLDYLKEHFDGDWCLVLDADEMPDEGISQLKNSIEKENVKEGLANIEMIHFINNFGLVDDTVEVHYVQNRLFRINKDLYYPGGEHGVLTSHKQEKCLATKLFKIYHLAYCRNMFHIRDRYINNMHKSNIHTKDFLNTWYIAHLIGRYKSKEFKLKDFPKPLRDFFILEDTHKWIEENQERLE
jgi:cellulose synthase/poly-beta-1,6-N-acetylglucosamine synthase-like glycosyltransferase